MHTTITYCKASRRHIFTCHGPAVACTKEMTPGQMLDHMSSFHGSPDRKAINHALREGEATFEAPLPALYQS